MGFRSVKRGYSLLNKNSGISPSGILSTLLATAKGSLEFNSTPAKEPRIRRRWVGSTEVIHKYPYYRVAEGRPIKTEVVKVERYTEEPQGRRWYGEGSGAPSRRLRQMELQAAKRESLNATR